jgi:hypothetical protein
VSTEEADDMLDLRTFSPFEDTPRPAAGKLCRLFLFVDEYDSDFAISSPDEVSTALISSKLISTESWSANIFDFDNCSLSRRSDFLSDDTFPLPVLANDRRPDPFSAFFSLDSFNDVRDEVTASSSNSLSLSPFVLLFMLV